MNNMNSPLLEVENLTIQYQTGIGKLTAVSNATFSLDRGEYLGLVGESGCGKSTMAKAIIAGLDANGEITSGKIRFNGTEIQDMPEREMRSRFRWKEISWIPQGSMNSLDPIERISDQAVEIARTHTDLSRGEALEKLRNLFGIVGLEEAAITKYPKEFSGGMQQRALIAFSLLLDPSLIIADEPTTALDVIMQDQVFAYLDDIKDEFDTSVMLISHDISVVLESCDKMAVMHGGQIAETGKVTDIYDSPRHPYSILLQRAFPHIHRFDERLEEIPGSPPYSIGGIENCSFVDRCPWAIEECRQSAPPLEPVNSTDGEHRSACFRKDEMLELTNGGD